MDILYILVVTEALFNRLRVGALALDLYECTLPVRRLKHRYTIVADGAGTVVRQRMEYELKVGALGRLLDALV